MGVNGFKIRNLSLKVTKHQLEPFPRFHRRITVALILIYYHNNSKTM